MGVPECLVSVRCRSFPGTLHRIWRISFSEEKEKE